MEKFFKKIDIDEEIETLLKEGVFSFVDIFFAKEILGKKSFKKLSKSHLALAFLFYASRKGHLCVKIIDNRIISPAFQEFKKYQDLIINGFMEIPSDLLEKKEDPYTNKPIIYTHNSYYLNKNFFYEFSLAKDLKERLNATSEEDKNLSFNDAKTDALSTLNAKQKKAALQMISRPMTILSGGPGSGKTYTAAIALKYLDEITSKNLKIAFLAPTGKAAMNLNSKMDLDFKNLNLSLQTIHFFLSNFKNKKSFQNYFDYIFIDEASMIDAKMMYLLFSKIPKKTKIILIGDPYQLPPIETGNLFSLFTWLYKENIHVKLDASFRCSDKNLQSLFELVKLKKSDSFITKVIENHLMIEMPNENIYHFFTAIQNKIDQYFLPFSYLSQNIEETLNSFLKFKILTSNKHTSLGSKNINRIIFDYLFSQKKEKSIFVYPILITQNDYNLNLFNGQLGIVSYNVKANEKIAYFNINGEIVSFPFFLLPTHECAYAMSIHKSQGSEFDDVVLLLPENSQFFGNEMLYTGLTRTKKNIKIISNTKTLKEMISTETPFSSNLLKRI